MRGNYPELSDLLVVELGGGRANGFEWHLAAVHRTHRVTGKASAVGLPCLFDVEDAGGEAAVSSSQPPSPC